MKIEIEVIGIVKNSENEPRGQNWKDIASEIRIFEKFKKAVEGLEEFSHIQVLFWLHRAKRDRKMIHPKNRKELPLVGVFATRTQHRPNPIGVTVAELLEIKDNVLIVRGLDALNKTPVLDVKAFVGVDIQNYKVPEWVLRLRNEKR
ncbi:MAG: tRNA (N6-threonylcarbamoyladenosine(37)-N6)-methyltransferase TrmO [Candidatus Methanofastidiosia archaeon]